MLRRNLLQATAVLPLATALSGCAQITPTAPAGDFEAALHDIERESGGRLGVAVFDTHTSRAVAWRGDERFPMCSTFKFLLAAQVLARVDAGAERLERRIAVLPSDMIPYAPVTQPRVGGVPMSVAELCEAFVTLSDNPAANMLLRDSGGPAALTAFVRALGDDVTRLNRNEPTLNEAAPGDARDTTSPRAMVRTMQRIVLGDALSAAGRVQINQWLLGSKTGAKKVRAGVPAQWPVGDKSGGGQNGTNNDIAVLWPPGRSPVLVAAYLTQTTRDAAARDQALARAGAQAAAWVRETLG